MPQQLSALLGVLHLFTCGGMISFLCHHMFFFSQTFFLSPALSLSLCLQILVHLSPIYRDQREYAVQAIIHGWHGDSISYVWHSRRGKSLKLITTVHYYFQSVPPAHWRSQLSYHEQPSSLALSSHPGSLNEHTVTFILWKLRMQALTLFQGHSTILIYNNSQKQGHAFQMMMSALKCRLGSFQFKDSGSVSDGGYAPWTWRGGSSHAWGFECTSVTDNGYVDTFFVIFEFYWTSETVWSVFFSIAQWPVVDTIPVHDLGHMNIECPFCAALHWLDEHVSSSTDHRPEFKGCCQHGRWNWMPFILLHLLSIIYLLMTCLLPKNSVGTLFNTMLLWHLHLWVSTLIARSLDMDHLSFEFMGN